MDIHFVARQGNTARLREYLNSSLDSLEKTDEHGRTMLLYAVKEDRLDTLQFLVESGANARATDRSGSTALHIAAEHGSVLCAQFLLTSCDLKDLLHNRTDSLRRTPSMIAEDNGHLQLSRLFTRYIAAEACMRRRSQDRGSVCSASTSDSSSDPSDYLIVKGKETIERLMKTEQAERHRKKVDMEKHRFLFTSWHIHDAIKCNQLDELKLILESTQSSRLEMLRDTYGKTPLMRAVWHNNSRALEMLLSYGANPLAKDWNGETALHKGAERNSVDCVRCILARVRCTPGFINAKSNILHNTPLHLASSRGHKDIVYMLMSHGADAMATNVCGETAQDLAGNKQQPDLVRYLAHVCSRSNKVYQPPQVYHNHEADGYDDDDTEEWEMVTADDVVGFMHRPPQRKDLDLPSSSWHWRRYVTQW